MCAARPLRHLILPHRTTWYYFMQSARGTRVLRRWPVSALARFCPRLSSGKKRRSSDTVADVNMSQYEALRQISLPRSHRPHPQADTRRTARLRRREEERGRGWDASECRPSSGGTEGESGQRCALLCLNKKRPRFSRLRYSTKRPKSTLRSLEVAWIKIKVQGKQTGGQLRLTSRSVLFISVSR